MTPELRAPTDADVDALAAMLAEPSVARWWGDSWDPDRVRRELLGDDTITGWVIVEDGAVAGWVQTYEEDDPQYRHVSLDISLVPSAQGRGVGPAVLQQLIDRYVADGHHRFTIDPAADNDRAIRAYAKLGFRPVGRLRRYERTPEGDWRDGLLMELIVGESSEPSPEEVMAAYLAAAQAGDFDTAYGFYADDIVFHVPGRPPGRGRAQVIAYIDEARASADAVEIGLVDRLVDGERVGLILDERFVRAEGTAVSRRLNLYTVRSGRITEIWMYEHDGAPGYPQPS